MENKKQQLKDLLMNRIQQLKIVLNKLTKGIVITDADEEKKAVQELQLQMLIESLGVLLVHTNPDQNISSVWHLIEPHLPEEIRMDEEQFKKYRDLLSQPLTGQPSDVLAKIGFSNPTNPMFKIIQQLREKMTPEQHQMLPQIVGRII